MTVRRVLRRSLLVLLLILLPACSAMPNLPGIMPATPTVPAATASPATTATLPGVTPTTTPGGPLTLRIWLPPQFDPAQDTAAGRLLRERFLEFTRERPRVTLDIRVKAPQGPGGLLDSLTTAAAAAPQALPDLTALPRDLLETAALKGLLYPYDPADLSIAEEDWYPYAQELAHVQDSLYGLPFAGDALTLVYRSGMETEPPADWTSVISGTNSLVFPAADPQALFTLTLYQAQGGDVRDEQSKPVIETLALTEVLTYYAQAKVVGIMTDELTQYQSDEQVWAAFMEGRAQLAVTWCSRYLHNVTAVMDENVLLAPLPTSNARPFTLASGWVWSLATGEPERQRVAAELANFLTESSFLAEWTEAVGYLPPYPAALAEWEDLSRQPAVLDRIARSAHILPPAEILTSLSAPLWQATIDVLKSQNDPIVAAQEAAASLNAP